MADQRLIDWLNDYETNMLDLYSDTETISISLKMLQVLNILIFLISILIK